MFSGFGQDGGGGGVSSSNGAPPTNGIRMKAFVCGGVSTSDF